MHQIKFLLHLNLFLINTAFSQNKFIVGKIIDSNDKTGIPYASVVIYQENYGVSCDSNGFFSLKIPEKYNNSYLQFSSIGYKDSIIKIKDFENKSINIALQSNIFQFNTVQIKAKKNRVIKTKRIRNSIMFQSERNNYTPYPRTIGKMFFPRKRYNNLIIKNIDIAFNRYFDYSYTPSFIIRIMNLDSFNLPDRDYTDALIINMDTCKQTGHYVYSKNIENLKISIPKEGIFVGIQWIISENNLLNETEFYLTHYSPTLKLKWRPGSKNKNIVTYEKGNWSKGGDSEPFIELTLTN